jgi:myosin-3
MSYLGLSEHIDLDNLPHPGDRFRLEQVIGEGTYGEVFKAIDLDSGYICSHSSIYL